MAACGAATLELGDLGGPRSPMAEDAQQVPYGAAALAAQLGRSLEQVSLGDANAHAARLGTAAPDTNSSSEAATAYASSDSSSGAGGDNQDCAQQQHDPSAITSYLQRQSSQGQQQFAEQQQQQQEGGRDGDDEAQQEQEDGQQQGGQQQEGGGKSQICFDFTKGVCTRGDKCKYSHDLATIVHFNSKEKGICFDYLRNQCHRGLLCRFSHDLSNIAQQCQVYSNAKENKGGGKPNAICYDFVKGVCQRGAECRYSHDLSLIARMARGGNTQQKAAEVCYDYLRGRCNRGSTCKYSHNISFLSAPGFLGSALSSDGTPLAASGGGSGGDSSNGTMSGALPAPVGFGGMGQMPGMPQRLSNAISADQATLTALAAAAAGQNPMGPMMPATGEGRRRSSMSLVSDGPSDASSMDQTAWVGMPPMAKAAMANVAFAQQAAALAMHQRMTQAAAAAGLAGAAGPYGHIPMSSAGGAVAPDMLAAHAVAAAGMYGPRPGMGPYGTDGGMPPMSRPSGLPPLPPNHTGNFSAESIAAILSSMPNAANGEALSMFAAAAKAQHAHQQAQAVRMMAAAAASGGGAAHMMSHGMMHPSGLPPMGPMSHGGTAPQSIPSRDSSGGGGAGHSHSHGGGYDGGYPNGGPAGMLGHQQQQQQAIAVGLEQLSRSAPAGPGGVVNPSTLNPDLLPPGIKEIWSKTNGHHHHHQQHMQLQLH